MRVMEMSRQDKTVKERSRTARETDGFIAALVVGNRSNPWRKLIATRKLP
jgi:hypothetical protein